MKTKPLFAALLALGGLVATSSAWAQSTRDQIRMIEQEYAAAHSGADISDNQLEYYLDRSSQGWSMDQVTADIRANGDNPWRPQSGYVATDVICTSINNAYAECAAPFRGTAVVAQQISQSACVEGRSWGQKPGVIWVNNGCRARFGIVRGGMGDGGMGDGGMDHGGMDHGGMDHQGNGNGGIVPPRMVTCTSYRGRYRVCNTGIRGRVQLVNRLNNSAACVEGRSWGQRRGVVWVNRGCRAQFASVGRPGWRDDRGQSNGSTWARDPNYSVTCASIDGRRTACTWDGRYGNPYIVQQISSSACIEGRDWGYDATGGLWVNSGCRARFGFR